MGCSSGCSPSCPCKYAPWLPRVAFGLILMAYGVNHYRNLSDFVNMAKSLFQNAPMLAGVAGLLAYIVPALMIVGGLLFAIKQLCCVSKMCILASLSGIIAWASLGVMFGDVNITGAAMPLIQNASVLLILYWVVKKMSCCGGGACTIPGKACACGKSPCVCPKK